MSTIDSGPRLRPPDNDMTLDYQHEWGHAGRCRVRIWRNTGLTPAVALVSDLGDENEGLSVTNAIETIGAHVERLTGQPIENVDLVEHYEPNMHRGHTLNLVRLEHDIETRRIGSPSWVPLPPRLAWLEDIVTVTG